MHSDHYHEGRALRKKTPRASHQEWKVVANRAEVIQQIALSSQGRIPDLIPERYRRMSKSPLNFYRATPDVMAKDLFVTPSLGITVQSSGDCHIMNFGAEVKEGGNIIFDMNDFDQTHPAPWEWDVKRLAVSFMLASHQISRNKRNQEQVVAALIRSYKKNLNYFSK